MNILGWLLFGFVVGLIARTLMPSKDPFGMIGSIVIGMLGALLGGWIGQALGSYGPDDTAGFIAATIGAVVILGIYYSVSPSPSRIQTSQAGKNKETRKETRKPAA